MPSTWLLDRLFALYFFLFPAKLKWKASKKPKKPALLVAQHVTWATDIIALYGFIYQMTGSLPSGLADRLHFRIPIWSWICSYFGAVVGNPENCAKLMNEGKWILVFPGGREEVFRTANDHRRYSLHWRERMGFARLAIKYEYDIIPISSVGAEHNVSILFSIPFDFFAKLCGERPFSVPIIFPNLAHIPIHLTAGKRIPTKKYHKLWNDLEKVSQLRNHVKATIMQQIARDKKEVFQNSM